jgi:hypothetical protein
VAFRPRLAAGLAFFTGILLQHVLYLVTIGENLNLWGKKSDFNLRIILIEKIMDR